MAWPSPVGSLGGTGRGRMLASIAQTAGRCFGLLLGMWGSKRTIDGFSLKW